MCHTVSMSKSTSRAPLPRANLNLPGAHITMKMLEMVFMLGHPVALFAFLLGMSIYAWDIHLRGVSLGPWFVTAALLLSGVYLYERVRKTYRDLPHYGLGRKGEVMVGQLLEGLRPYGYTPIHDVPCTGKNGKEFNIDHVLVGPRGVFAIETKTWSKTNGENEKMTFRDGALYAGSRRRSDAEILQAQRNGQWLLSLLETRSGRSFPVHAILTFPGWYVERDATSAIRDAYGVYTLTPKAIGPYLGKYIDTSLSDDEIQQVVKVISNYVYEQAENDR
jgi:hypothetical protein